MPKKIAIISDGNIYNRKGQFNAVHNRIKYLKNIADYDIDVFLLSTYDTFISRFLRHSSKAPKVPTTEIDGIKYNIKWIKFSIIDYILFIKFKKNVVFRTFFLKKLSKEFSKYDLLSVHSYDGGMLALISNQRYGTPYCVTWHGSDIHSLPNANKFARNNIKRIIENAKSNFFVSRKLLEQSNKITTEGNKTVLYNGYNGNFKKYTEEIRNKIKKELNVENKKVVGFVGNIIEIKNANLLPSIFHSIQKKYSESIAFWIIGDGHLRHSIEKTIFNDKTINVKFWGNQPPESIPNFMNCLDVLILPSKNEGLPLVTVEAIACGANVVGSDVGGISEAIGKEFCFELNDKFVDNISSKVVELLYKPQLQTLSNVFNWKNTAIKENTIYKKILQI